MTNLDVSTKTRIIRRALEILKSNGWTKGSFVNKQNEYCALGALDKASSEILPDDAVTPFDLEADFTRTIREMTGKSGGVVNYNDAPETTFSEVVDLFRNTLRRIKEGA